MTGAKKRFSGIGSISNVAPVVSPPPALSSPKISGTACPEPLYAASFRASVARIAAVYSSKLALVSFMARCDGGFSAAATRSGDQLIQAKVEISKALQVRAGQLAVAGAGLPVIEDILLLWEQSEVRLLDLLDTAAMDSQMRLI